jgi:hypothetical protein
MGLSSTFGGARLRANFRFNVGIELAGEACPLDRYQAPRRLLAVLHKFRE